MEISAGQLPLVLVFIAGITLREVGAILDKTETSQKQEACLGVPGNVTENVVHCKTLWDGSMCWRNAEPGQIVSLPCPLTMESQDSFVIRECNSNGSWSKANYSQCLKTSEPNNESHYTALIDKWIPIIHIMSQIGYTVSLTTLVIAFVLLSCMKKLRCPRNTLLLHLFFSFMMRAAMKLIKDILFVKGVGLAKDVIVAENGFVDFLPDRNKWECKAIIAFSYYCITANYSWILMEGLYLHNLIFLALFTDTSTIMPYVLMGWGLPIVFITVWIIMRINHEDTFCWNTHENSNIYYLIHVPIFIIVLICFALFLNIVRVLMVKMQSTVYLERRKLKYKRWAKSTLVLVPLFGVHYVVFVWVTPYIEVSDTLRVVNLFFDQFFTSFQGFLVALLYCLLNTEVQAEVVRKWKYYNYNKEHCKRGSAHSLPAGLNSVLTTSRVYNCQRGSLSSSGVTPPFGDMELKGQDIQTVSKYLQDQRQEMTDYKPDKRPSLTQEIILNSLCNGDICYNPSCRHIAHAQNGFADHIGKPYHISYDGLDNSDLSPTMQTAFLPQGSSYQRRRSADSNTGHSQGFPKAQNGYASAHDDYCTSGKCLSSLGASRST